MEFKLNIAHKVGQYDLLIMRRKASAHPKILNIENFSDSKKIVLAEFKVNDDLVDEINIRLERYDIIKRIIISAEKEYEKFAENLQYELIDLTNLPVIINYI